MSPVSPLPLSRRRVRLGIGTGPGARAAERWAADMARALDAEIDAVFVESEALLALARLPVAREITATTRVARGVDPERIERDMRASIAAARRRMDRIFDRAGPPGAVRVERGGPAQALTGRLAPGDLVVLARPGPGPGTLVAMARTGLAALAAGADVLLVPGAPAHGAPAHGAPAHGAPAHGAIVQPEIAVATGAGPGALTLADALARARGVSVALIEDEDLSLRQIIDAARARSAIMLLVTLPDAERAQEAFDQVIARSGCPVMILGVQAPAA